MAGVLGACPSGGPRGVCGTLLRTSDCSAGTGAGVAAMRMGSSSSGGSPSFSTSTKPSFSELNLNFSLALRSSIGMISSPCFSRLPMGKTWLRLHFQSSPLLVTQTVAPLWRMTKQGPTFAWKPRRPWRHTYTGSPSWKTCFSRARRGLALAARCRRSLESTIIRACRAVCRISSAFFQDASLVIVTSYSLMLARLSMLRAGCFPSTR